MLPANILGEPFARAFHQSFNKLQTDRACAADAHTPAREWPSLAARCGAGEAWRWL
jgi:hypothetical protein